MKTIFEQLVERCEPFLEFYRDDLLVHDRKTIEDNPGVPFFHWTRSTGTTMALLVPPEAYPAKGEEVPYLFGTADREHILNSIRVTADAVHKDTRSPLWIYYDGENLRGVSYEQVKQIIRDYETRVRDAWRGRKAA